jgi:hypothetical protein
MDLSVVLVLHFLPKQKHSDFLSGDTKINEVHATAEYWKAEHLAGNKRITELEEKLLLADS